MYKLSVPIGIPTINDETLPKYLELFRKCKVDRVFLCPLDSIEYKSSVLYKNSETIKKAVKYFKDHGYEVGIWVNAFGHGDILVHSVENEKRFTQIEGIGESESIHANCPLDEDFKRAYINGIRSAAEFHPDILMIDDDFRINLRQYYMGCFCKKHLEKYCEMIGEKVEKSELEKLIFTGGKNKYRDAYMKLMADTLLDFASDVRAAVNDIDKNIRISACSCYDRIDYSGTDEIEIARVFAGDTEPYIRTIGAPYWDSNVIGVIENNRLQAHWYKNKGIEVFAEGDPYPRQRYKISSKVLELYDIALSACGDFQGILKYMYHYAYKLDYETCYYESHIRNIDLKARIDKIFEGKTPVGVNVYSAMHKIENWELPLSPCYHIAEKLIQTYCSPATSILSKNSIPTTYENTGYPMLVFGEDARYISIDDLKQGAILDATAAMILKSRGVDTGIVSLADAEFSQEYFANYDDTILGVANGALKEIKCADSAVIYSKFIPSYSPASYTYENAEKMKFFVLAFDHYMAGENLNYTNNYYRQSDVIKAVEWMSGKSIPAKSLKNPNLYIMASKDDTSMSVLLMNVCLDDIIAPEIMLDREYSEISFVNCTGKLIGNKVVLSDLSPYGIAAFEVK